MIKNPWPLYWEAPRQTIHCFDFHHHNWHCRYAFRHNMLCFNEHKKYDCLRCYMRQQASKSPEVKHVCDRCGYESNGADDHLTYLTLENRQGGIIVQAELCQGCATQLGEWLKNNDFFENFWKDEEPGE